LRRTGAGAPPADASSALLAGTAAWEQAPVAARLVEAPPVVA
jgi:hypothetical protein